MSKRITLTLWFLLISLIGFQGCSPVSSTPGLTPSTSPLITLAEIPQRVFIQNPTIREADGMTQITLPGGTFFQGSTEEQVSAGIELCQQHYTTCNRWYYEREYPQHEVTLSPFLIDQSEVTNQQFQGCIEAGSCGEQLGCKKGDPTIADPQKADHPVVCVSWEDARNYCEWVGGRLPTEAEWEFAFRGEESLLFPWGDEFIGSNLNYCDVNCDQGHADQRFDDGYLKTAPAGSFATGRSGSGLYNMAGNVSEWVNDWYGEYGPGQLINPSGPSSGTEKLIKGCSWYSPPAYCRGAARGSVDPANRLDYLGFRCAGGASPVIDGFLQPGEWDQADQFHLEDGSELYLLLSGDDLYVAIRALPAEMIAGNVFLHSGDRISIYHSSAALGTASYQAEGDSWVKIKDFEWCCRSRVESEAAQKDRETFFEGEGWRGINSFLGNTNELEFQIRLSVPDQSLAVNFVRANDPNRKQVWPSGLVDGPAQPSSEGFPDRMEFFPEYWQDLEGLR